MERTPGPVVFTTGRGCVSPPGLMNANLCGSICVYCISGHVWPLQPSSLTRGRPPQPPRPLLPRPKPRWRRGAKRLDGAAARTGGYHHRQRLCQPSGLDECQSVWIDLCVLHEWPCVAITAKQPYARSAPSTPPPLTPPAKAPVKGSQAVGWSGRPDRWLSPPAEVVSALRA
jgi:hypothetical protein